ncbi:MAG TPA: flagellar hook assembly protein FlgD [Steroidobacteraceae bacterium]|nr:flagellar hook assembly protein FlgD [Steroidobacteraceae bacterium]
MSTSVNPYDFLNGSHSAASQAAAAASQSAQSNQQLGQNEFLKLMLAQLKNQDPTKPADPTQFLSQLAQFSTVTGIQNMQTSMEDLAASLRSTQVLNGASLVGHDVLAPATTNVIAAGQSVKGAAEAPNGTSEILVTIKDSSGALVRAFTTPASAGMNEFTWDGKDNLGNAVPAGQYSFEVTANVAGQAEALDPLLSSKVASVTIDPKNGSLTLNTSTGAVPLTDVRRVL